MRFVSIFQLVGGLSLVLANPYASIAGSAAPPSPLKVLSYNIKGLPLPVGVDHTRYADIAAALRSRRQAGTAPHVVVIQEAFHIRTNELVTRSGYRYHRWGPQAAGSQGRSGLLILSDYPIRGSGSIAFSRCISFDCFVRKGVLYAKIEIPGLPRPLVLLTTHFNADPSGDPTVLPSQTRAVRMFQIAQTQEFLADLIASSDVSIFAGDFNFRVGDPDYLAFADQTGFQSAGEICAASADCQKRSDLEEEFEKSVDHAYIQSGEHSAVDLKPVFFEKTFKKPVRGRVLSDHDGLEWGFKIDVRP